MKNLRIKLKKTFQFEVVFPNKIRTKSEKKKKKKKKKNNKNNVKGLFFF